MLDIGSTELLLIVIVAILVIGPKDLPRALYKVGQVVGKARGMARHFRTGIDAMVREVELQELEKKWADQNRRIMEEHPPETVPAVAADLAHAPDPAIHNGDGIASVSGADADAGREGVSDEGDRQPQLDLSDTPMTPLPKAAAASPPASKSDEAA